MQESKVIEFWKTAENPITCYLSLPTISVDLVKRTGYIRKTDRSKVLSAGSRKQPVTVKNTDGKITEYESVVKAADALEMDRGYMYAILNKQVKNKTGFEIFKSTLNDQ